MHSGYFILCLAVTYGGFQAPSLTENLHYTINTMHHPNFDVLREDYFVSQGSRDKDLHKNMDFCHSSGTCKLL